MSARLPFDTAATLLYVRCLLALSALAAAPHTHAQPASPDAAQIANILEQARAYESGDGVMPDPGRAVRLYCKAARFGDVEAQFSLGRMYADGRGVARDEPVAALFFMLAAQQGHQQAHRMLPALGEPTAAVPECLREPLTLAEAFPEREPPGPPPPRAESPEPTEPFVAVTAAQKKALEIVNRLAPEFGVDPRLALAVIRAESNFDPAARSEKNAQGLMQLIPDTSLRFNVGKPFDPVQNVRGGLAYLRWLLAYFQGDVVLVAAAYNAGERAVNRYRGIPPYPETRSYVKRVVQFFGRTEHPYDPAVTEASPELQAVRAVSTASPKAGNVSISAAP